MTKKELTEKQKMFCKEFIIDFNGSRAYKKVYKCNDGTSRTNSVRQLTNAHIQKEIKRLTSKVVKKLDLKAEDIISELRLLGFSNLYEILKNFGKGTMTDEQQRCLSQIETKKFKDGTIKAKIKACDKVKSLELLGKYFGIFKDNIDIGGEVNIVFTNKSNNKKKK